jgi:serine/threonine-protein kinase
MSDKPGLTGATPLSVGDVIAQRYRVVEELGRGGYAIVYRAMDLRTEAIIALKTIRPIAPRPDEVRARFQREAELVSRLKHPNTVRVFDFGFETDFFLAMELLEGQPLSDMLDGQNGLALARCIHFGKGVLDSLSEAHGLGIVHRDLKPENVFVVQRPGPDGHFVEHVKVLDFGIAKAIQDDIGGPSLTLKGRAMGTPAYMSPEQAKGGRLSIHSDLYAVGVLLYEMICGVAPFSGDSAMTIMLKHVNEAAPPLIHPHLRGSALEQVILRALSKNPFDRFESASDMGQRLMEAFHRLQAPPAPPTGLAAPLAHAAIPPPPSQGQDPSQQLRKENLFASWFKRKA